MKVLYLTTMLVVGVLLAACSQGTENATAPANTGAEATGNMGAGACNMSSGMGNMGAGACNMSGDMGNMAMPTAKTVKGSGTVTAIDKTAGTVTLDHGAITEANWPAMTMAFKATPKLLDSVKVGDKVSFELALKDDTGEVTAISKQ